MAAATFTALFTTAGTFTWVAPAGVTAVSVQCWGSGGGGAGQAVSDPLFAAGGGGGEYAAELTNTCVAGDAYTVVVGAAGAAGASGTNAGGNGNSSSFTGTSATTVTAHGGTGGEDGATGQGNGGPGGTGSTNTVHFNGGTGGSHGGAAPGGGGGSGGTGTAGNTGGNGTQPNGAAAVTGGGPGGTAGTSGAGQAPVSGPGGGGGAGNAPSSNAAGGAGFAGQVLITWTMNTPAVIAATTSGGTYQWTAPSGITSVDAQAIGGGAAGGGATATSTTTGGGGGGGEDAEETALAVTAGNSYTFVVGAAGAGASGGTGGGGGNSTMAGDSVTVTAHGGTGGAEGTNGAFGAGGTGSSNTIHHNGGAGAAGVTNSTGGGGGSSAGTSAAGNAGSGSTGGTAVTGGGPGGAGATTASHAGNAPASGPGGGGGGARGGTAELGGAGFAGQLTLTWSANVAVALTTPNITLAAPLLTPSAGATLSLTTPNVALAAPLLTPGVPPPTPPAVTAAWSGSYSRDPIVAAAGPPALTPLAIPVSNTAGQWVFALITWRQDAGVPGFLQYPSTVSVSDDAANFWIPVYSGLAASSSSASPSTGIVRNAVWMAPAARQAQYVFVAPTAYQSAVTAYIFTVQGACPWYQVDAVAGSFTNQGTSVTLSQSIPSNVLAIGLMAWDLRLATVTTTSTGWTALNTQSTTNGNDTTGDLQQDSWLSVGSGTSLTLSSSASAFAPMTVTATAAGVTSDGIVLAVRVITGAQAAAAQAANAASNAFGTFVDAPATPQGAITPNGTGSFLYESILEGGTHTTYTPLSSSTFFYNAGDSANNLAYGMVRGTSKSTAGTPVTLGGSAPTSIDLFLCIAEILAETTVAEDASTPSVASTAAATTITSASFQPPFGSLLVAVAGSSSNGGLTMSVSDSTGRTWYKLATSKTGQDNVTIWVADVPPMDWADVIVAISGVSDARAYPYGTPVLENWPELVTEIAAGPALNADPVFAYGTTFWTGTGAAVAAVSQPLFQPLPSSYQTVLYGSLQVTPSGSASLSYAASETEAVSAVVQYTATAWAYSPSGYGAAGASGLYAGIQWLTSGLSVISVTAGSTVTPEPGEWTQLSAGPVFPPQNAAYAQIVIGETGNGSSVPAAAVFYAGYGSFGAGDAYEAVPPDQIAWTDVSTRNFTQGDIEVSRGIQYEDQSLEAGTMTVYLANEDAAMTFGNVASPFWPNIGDTDVPIRLRAIWPGSLTPYVVMFSGFTDDVKYGWDTSEETWYGYAQVTASDGWSRLTQQMLAAVENEALIDNPVAFISCNQNGANTISTGPYSAPAQSILASIGQVPVTAAPTASFTGGAISITGAAGLSCWQSAGTRAADPQTFGRIGYCLVWLPTAALQVGAGQTVEFWYCPVSDWSAQAVTNVTVCQALGAQGAPVWTLSVDNGNPGAESFQSFLQISTPAGTFNVGSLITFFSTTTAATANYYIVVSWTTTAITVTVNPGDPELTETLTLTGQDFSTEWAGLSFGGVINPPVENLDGFGDTAIADIAIFDYLMPPARSAARYFAGLTAFASDSDNWRLARVTGYSGFVPVLGMRGLDLPVPPAADVDLVTGATDTNTQVVSAYFTNEASSTLAAMFVNGPGTLIYRRRQEWYNRAVGQYVTGEVDSQSLSLGINPLKASFSTAGWTTGSGATLTSGSGGAAGGALFVPSAGLFAGNGSTSNPFIITTSNPAVTPGEFYQFTVWLYSAQGWTSGGVTAQVQFFNASNVQVGATATSPPVNLVAGSVGYAVTPAAVAPATAAYLKVAVQANGTPPNTTGFYVAAAQAFLVTPDYAAGAGVAVPEAPYLPDMHLGSDRAQLYNYAVLTQYGTNLISSFSGSSVLFTPSSGVVVTVTNAPSAALRGQVPYTATIYLNNTEQASPYYLNEGSIEDFGSWITQTLGSPLFRPDAITLTPAATPSALTTALQAEIGDTISFRRRPMGGPEIQILSYYSKLTHNISKDKGTWTTEMELSPFPQGSVLTCDDVVHGVLTGQNLLGW